MLQLISFDLEGDFGFFRKPDTNDGISLSYNLIHKPSLLGILGAILGLEGYKENGKWPAYHQKLKHLKLGIEPINKHEHGNFDKMLIAYSNTVGFANRDAKKNGANQLLYETTLIQPAFRVYLLLETQNILENELLNRIQKGKAVFVPYFGKNEHQLWWDVEKVRVYSFKAYQPTEEYSVRSIFIKTNKAASRKETAHTLPFLNTNSFAYFEEIPIGFNEALFQYELSHIAYTNWKLTAEQNIQNLYQLKDKGESFIVQLF